MKTLLASFFFAVLLCGSAAAAEINLDDALSKSTPELTGLSSDQVNKYYPEIIGADKHASYREVLAAYASKDEQKVRFVGTWLSKAGLWKKIVTRVEQLADTATKAGDKNAAIYRRAAEKLAQQVKETGVRQDAQAAVADLLKALATK